LKCSSRKYPRCSGLFGIGMSFGLMKLKIVLKDKRKLVNIIDNININLFNNIDSAENELLRQQFLSL
jgi:hypothetical protein